MYDFISNLIGHTWITGQNAPGDQSYIVTGCVVLIVLLTIFVAKMFSNWLTYTLNIFRH